MNLEIRQLEDNIIDLLNQSDVCDEAKRLVVSNVLNLVTKNADKVILNEIKMKGESDVQRSDQLGE